MLSVAITDKSVVPLTTLPACRVRLVEGVEEAERRVNAVKFRVESMIGSLNLSSTVPSFISISNSFNTGPVVSGVTSVACKP